MMMFYSCKSVLQGFERSLPRQRRRMPTYPVLREQPRIPYERF